MSGFQSLTDSFMVPKFYTNTVDFLLLGTRALMSEDIASLWGHIQMFISYLRFKKIIGVCVCICVLVQPKLRCHSSCNI